jgi:hypothetical protein
MKNALQSGTPFAFAMIVVFALFMLYEIYADWRAPKSKRIVGVTAPVETSGGFRKGGLVPTEIAYRPDGILSTIMLLRFGFFMLALTFRSLTSVNRCLQVMQPTIQLPPEPARVLTDYEKAWSDRDGAALARPFVEDGFVLPDSRP